MENIEKIIGLEGLNEFKKKIDEIILDHKNASKPHPELQRLLEDIMDRISAIESVIRAEITANPFSVTFGQIEGIEVDGVWDDLNARIGF